MILFSICFLKLVKLERFSIQCQKQLVFALVSFSTFCQIAKRAPLSQPMRSTLKTYHDLLTGIFPSFTPVACICFGFFGLVHCAVYNCWHVIRQSNYVVFWFTTGSWKPWIVIQSTLYIADTLGTTRVHNSGNFSQSNVCNLFLTGI